MCSGPVWWGGRGQHRDAGYLAPARRFRIARVHHFGRGRLADASARPDWRLRASRVQANADGRGFVLGGPDSLDDEQKTSWKDGFQVVATSSARSAAFEPPVPALAVAAEFLVLARKFRHSDFLKTFKFIFKIKYEGIFRS